MGSRFKREINRNGIIATQGNIHHGVIQVSSHSLTASFGYQHWVIVFLMVFIVATRQWSSSKRLLPFEAHWLIQWVAFSSPMKWDWIGRVMIIITEKFRKSYNRNINFCCSLKIFLIFSLKQLKKGQKGDIFFI